VYSDKNGKTRKLPTVLVVDIDVKNVFLRFLKILVTFFYVFNVFLFSKRFYFFKNVGKVQSGKQINKKRVHNNSNEIRWVHK